MPAVITPRPEFAAILRQEETFAVEGDTSMGNRVNSWFDRLMLQSGLELGPAMLVMLSLFCAIAVGGGIFVWQENLLTTALASFIGFLIPVIYAVVVRSRRQSEMSRQLPPMIDELARAARTGRSLDHCLNLVADDTPRPLGAELRLCTRKMSLGLDVEEALRDLPARTGLVGTSILSTALSVHRRNGGDLVRVLDRLSQTLRDRQHFHGRLKAATAASRATAILMIALPPAILAFFMFRDPTYISTLLQSTWGFRSMMGGFLLELIGAIWVIRVLQKSQQQ